MPIALMLFSLIRSLNSFCIHNSRSCGVSRLTLRSNGNDNTEFLLRRVLQRSQRALLSNLPDNDDVSTGGESSVTSLLETASQRADQVLRFNQDKKQKRDQTIANAETIKASQHTDYGKNPAITTTALAHLLWSHVLQDATHTTVIDATAGNGNDAVLLAKLLFTQNQNSSNRLLCLDIQDRACQVTRQRLKDVLPEPIFRNNVQVLHQSHASFPESHQQASLVVYNLGYLPNSTHLEGDDAPDKRIKTNTESTLDSLMNAVTRIQVGGMLSVMTYPKSDAVEDAAVQAFCQGLALFSSQTHDWRRMFDDEAANDSVLSLSPLLAPPIRQQLRNNLETVLKTLGRNTTWRAQEYKKMGWVDAPILITAFRIK